MAMEPARNSSAPEDLSPEAYENYDAFLKQAVREYYTRGWKSRRGNFIALILASGQVIGLAKDSVMDGSGLRTAALGAAGVVALRLGLRYFFAGPVGVVLSAALLGSAAGYLLKHRGEITAKLTPYRTLISDTRTRFEEIQTGHRAKRYDDTARNLMVEGLRKRFLDEVDA